VKIQRQTRIVEVHALRRSGKSVLRQCICAWKWILSASILRTAWKAASGSGCPVHWMRACCLTRRRLLERPISQVHLSTFVARIWPVPASRQISTISCIASIVIVPNRSMGDSTEGAAIIVFYLAAARLCSVMDAPCRVPDSADTRIVPGRPA
jgi:hypothetical protein